MQRSGWGQRREGCAEGLLPFSGACVCRSLAQFSLFRCLFLSLSLSLSLSIYIYMVWVEEGHE